MQDNYLDLFNPANSEKAYQKMKAKSLPTGVDRITKSHFDRIREEVFISTYNKIKDTTFKPIPYKELLIIKDRNSKPRMLSLPTIIDKVILSILRDILDATYHPSLSLNKVPNIIADINETIKDGKYDYYFKIDLTNYYGSINHKLLTDKVSQLIDDSNIIKILRLYLKNPTNCNNQNAKKITNKKGVPQGISISNILGNIYLDDFDKIMINTNELKYYRYVDDILIFCNSENYPDLYAFVKSTLTSEYHVKMNQKKLRHGLISDIDFLGYNFAADGKIGISPKNVKKLQNSLEQIFSEYKTSRDNHIRKNIELLKWKIDFRITGCFNDQKRYGWVIFFSQNEDETIMYKLDSLIVKLAKRYKLDKDLVKDNRYVGKKFVRTYHEYRNRQTNAEYIPNINTFTAPDKRHILINICHRKSSYIDGLDEFSLNREFGNFIFHSIRDIEHDLQQIYT